MNKPWSGVLRVYDYPDEPSSRWFTCSTRAWNLSPGGCDHTVTAETRAKAHTVAVREHIKCVERRAAAERVE